MDKMKGLQPEIPKNIHPRYAELIKQCMSFDPKQRPSFNQIVSLLKSNEFLIDGVDKNEFSKFIEKVQNTKEYYEFDHNLSNYNILKEIGHDYSGRYFKVSYKETGKKYTMKKINIEKITKLKIHEFTKLTEILMNVNSEFIIKYKNFNLPEEEEHFINPPTVIYDYYRNGNLSDFLGNCNITTKLKIIYGIASGMACLHSEGIIHNALSVDCVYIDKDTLPKISNFDVSVFFGNENKKMIYLAPEILKENEYDQSVDVYSFSIILYFICTGQIPNIKLNEKLNGVLPEIPKNVPKNYANLIRRCMSFDPKQRPSFIQIISLLKSSEFMTDKIDQKEFNRFIKTYDFQFEKIQIEFPEVDKLDVDFDPIDLSLYEKSVFIGRGGYGNVYKVIEKSTRKIVAGKINHIALKECTPIHVYSLSREINILSKLINQSILKFIGYNEYNFKGENRPTILTEYSQNNSLGNIIELQIRGLTPHEWTPTKELICAYGIAAGMAYIHSLDIIHRDLKPGNVFLDEYLHPKIGDFGLSKEISDESILEDGEHLGTPAFMSPEILNSYSYSKQSDVYAYGILLYEMFTKERPFNGKGLNNLFKSVIKGERPEFKFYINKCYKDLIEKCWSGDPNKRPTFDQILTILEKDEFITDEIDEDEYQDYISLIKTQKVKKPFKSIKIDFERITKKIIDELSTAIMNLNLSKFAKEKFIRREGNYKVYKIKNKETNEFFLAKKSIISIIYLSSKETIHLQREINILTKLNHPVFLKFIGFSIYDFQSRLMPVIVTEMPPNNSLMNLLQLERSKKHKNEWTDTRKLITIYGISSGMSFLHSHDVIHRNLSPESIFFDDYLHPKIGNFGLLTQIHSKQSLTHQTTIGLKGNFAYASPELLEDYEYSKCSDVYAFALIVYEIMTNKIPFEHSSNQSAAIFKEVVIKNNRPKFDVEIGYSYRKLIESCWSQNPEDRPTFEMIENILTIDSGFITKNVNKVEFYNYVKLIKKSTKNFNEGKKSIDLDELISMQKSIEHKAKEEKSKSSNKNEAEEDNSKSKSSNKNESKEDNSKSKSSNKNESIEDNSKSKSSKTDGEYNSKNPTSVKNRDEQVDSKPKSSVDFKKSISDLLNKKFIGQIDSDFVDFLFYQSESFGSSLTTSDFIVKLGEHQTDNDFISLKLLKKKIYKKKSKGNEIDYQKVDKFAKLLKTIKHPNIVRSLGFYSGDRNQAPTFLYEFYSKRLSEVVKTLDDAYLISIIYEIGHAMMTAHSNKIIHRNLNQENIFVDCEKHAKIGEFGVPILMSQEEQAKSNQQNRLCCFSREFLLNEEEINEKNDIFAFGMIVQYILKRGRKPFLKREDILSAKKAKIPKSLNKLSFSIVSQCLSHSQKDRPSFQAIINTIKRYDFKMIDGIDDKIKIIKNQLKSIIENK